MKATSLQSKKKPNKGQPSHLQPWAAIIGNPNSGKTALFNRLTGSHHKTGNYPGITVEQKSARLKGHPILIKDLPGTYSLKAQSLDEQVVVDVVQSWRQPENRPLAVIAVTDATNLSRNLFLTLQILDWQVPVIVVLNMIDAARKQDIHLDPDLLKEGLGAHAVIAASAKTGEGVEEIIAAVAALSITPVSALDKPRLRLTAGQSTLVEPLRQQLAEWSQELQRDPLVEALELLAGEKQLERLAPLLPEEAMLRLQSLLAETGREAKTNDMAVSALEAEARYRFIDELLAGAEKRSATEKISISEKADTVLSHPLWGGVILLLVLAVIFNTIFSLAEYPMGWVEGGVGWFASLVAGLLPEGALKSLLVDGIIAGVGNVLVFFPQIVLLIFFLSLLEDTGYITRMAFILDRLMRRIGLQGKAVLPMLSGFACAIPAIMASRTIENWRDRLLTILLIPLMSCSARLPVYTLMISAFVPQKTFAGFIQLQGMVLMAMYFLGFLTAILISLLVKKFVPERSVSHFIMELPPYRTPLFRSVWRKVYDAGKLFLVNAGSIILAVSIVLWFLASYPQQEDADSMTGRERVEQSYIGRLGRFVEPAIEPLGFDWKMGVGIIASFAAREVLVSTFATIYNVESDDEENMVPLIEAMQRDRKADGSPVFTLLSAISLMVFFVYAAQCMATVAVIKRETNSWLWPGVMVVYMTALAYLASLLVFQGGQLLGIG